jgi:hypothetical protein
MGSVIHHLEQTPAKPLYHYTTQEGLLGIVKNREIWATHTQYLNDRLEYKHALEISPEDFGDDAAGDRRALLETRTSPALGIARIAAVQNSDGHALKADQRQARRGGDRRYQCAYANSSTTRKVGGANVRED